jgi:hypothetical protein
MKQQLLNIFKNLDKHEQAPTNRYPDWKLHEICPVCKSHYNCSCKCMLADHSCPNGHHWFICSTCKNTVIGQSDHSKYFGICQCNSTAFFRTEA